MKLLPDTSTHGRAMVRRISSADLLRRGSNSKAAGRGASDAGASAPGNTSMMKANTMLPGEPSLWLKISQMINQLLLGEAVARIAANTEREGLDRFVIHPANRLKAFFDVVVMVSTLYVLLSTPLVLSFGQIATQLDGLDLFIDVLFIVDVLLQFFHGYVEKGYPVIDLMTVAWRYFTSWFAVELIASVPYSHIVTNPSPALTAVSLLRAFRLRRLSEVVSSTKLFSNVQSSGVAAFVRVVQIISVWLIVAHMFACIFVIIGWRMRCTGRGYSETWISTLWPQMELPDCQVLISCTCDGARIGTLAQVPHA